MNEDREDLRQAINLDDFNRTQEVRRVYVSCSEETVNFYKAMGAVAADDPFPAIAEAEPCDIQMTCTLEEAAKERRPK